MKVAAECIPTNWRVKCRVPWESTASRGKRASIKKAKLIIKETQQSPMRRNLSNHRKNQLKHIKEENKTRKNNLNTFNAKSIKSEIQ